MMSKIIQDDLAYMAKADLPWHKLAGKVILVAGANGALPAYMVELILYLNQTVLMEPATVLALVRNKSKAQQRFQAYSDNKNLQFIVQDVCEPLNFSGTVDIIIHAASLASPKYYGQNPVGTLLPNVLGTYNLLELARQKKSETFLFFSSGAVYGPGSGSAQTTENDFGPIDPLTINSCYAESKRMGENMCAAWLSQYQVPVKIVRPFHTYGPGISLDDGRAFADFCKNIVNNENIVLNSDGGARRSFCYLADAVVGFFTVLLKGEVGQAYNVTSSEEVSILELAQTLVALFPEKKLQVIYKQNQDSNYLPIKTSAAGPNFEKLKNLGWQPRYSIQGGFKRMIDNYLYEQIK